MIFDIEWKSDLFFQVFHHLCDAGLCVTEFCAYTGKAAWGFEEYEKELTNNGKFGRITLYDKILTYIVVPVFMVIIILNVFGFIR